MVEYPPYVDAYGQLKELFQKIKDASVPTKFNQDFLHTMLGLKSSSYRPMIPFLKRLGFLDQANVPTKVYSEFRDKSKSRVIMAQQVKNTYKLLFSAHSYANKLGKDEIISKLNTVLGTSTEDKTVPKIAATFLELCKLSDFEGDIPVKPKSEKKEEKPYEPTAQQTQPKMGISYTINLNLPATNDVEVFNAIFKALKENLLK